MLSQTTLCLAEKFRQNWETQYPYSKMEKTDIRNFQPNINKRYNRIINPNIPGFSTNTDAEDDSLTNLNWLQDIYELHMNLVLDPFIEQNLNFFSMSQSQPPLSPSPTHQTSSPLPQYPLSINPMNQLNRIIPKYFESSSLYAEVAMNLQFMNDKASVDFFKLNNQLRPPFSDINLISMAIQSYNKVKVSFPEICQWIEETFPYYKSLQEDWKTGIKNHLTLSKCFQKVPRRREEAGKGGFWRFSNDFLNYLERNRIQQQTGSIIFDGKLSSRHENNNFENHLINKFGKINNRKRTVNSIMSQDENRNSAFKIPKRKWLFNETITENEEQISNINQTNNEESTIDMNNCKSSKSLLLQYQDNSRNSLCNMNPLYLPITSGCSESMTDVGMNVLTTSDISQIQGPNNIFNQNINCSQISQVVNINDSPCPEQVTEEEFLSGKAFNNNYITMNSNGEQISSLLDTQNTFNSNEFNINDLSITGIGLKPPEWWNQSLSASQISLSKFNCSFRSLTVANNQETVFPFCIGLDEDHHGIWPTDMSNLSELDVLFGLS